MNLSHSPVTSLLNYDIENTNWDLIVKYDIKNMQTVTG